MHDLHIQLPYESNTKFTELFLFFLTYAECWMDHYTGLPLRLPILLNS